MWFDYGYIEDDRRRPYDLKLIYRLLKHARPYLTLLALSCLVILAATATDLVLPYLSKLAVDRCIVVSALEVHSGAGYDPRSLTLLEKYRRHLTPSGRPGLDFLKNDQTKEIDPADLTNLKTAGVIKPEPYYLVETISGPIKETISRRPELFTVHPRLAAIHTSDLVRLEPADLARLRGSDVTRLGQVALLCCLALLLGYLFNLAHVVLLEYIGQRLSHDLRQTLLGHVLKQSITFHDQATSGRLVSRLTNDVQNLNEMTKSVAMTFFKDAFLLVGIVVVLVSIDLRLALITFALLPPIILLSSIFQRVAREVFRLLRTKIAEINVAVSETVAGIRVIQAFRREGVNQRQFDKINHDNYLAGLRQIGLFAVFMPIVDVMASMALALIIWYGGLGVRSETMTLGAVVAFIGYTRMFFQPIRDLAEKFNILQSAMASLERIFGLLDHQAALPEVASPSPLPPPRGAITFDHVSFAYNSGPPVLTDLCFEVTPGQTLAIVGATGAGKTSVISLLLRFYDLNGGRITVDGMDIKELTLADHRRRIGLVMQDVFLFDGTVQENIAFSREGLPMERIKAAAEAVGAMDFIQALPGGFDYRLGEGGRTLSMGQRQLLSFARVLAQDPQILVLDEATANIDSDTEKLIEVALERLIKGRTSIIIAHRLSTIRRADKIMVLHQGRAMEMGTHDELMARRGLYYRLHQLQIRGIVK